MLADHIDKAPPAIPLLDLSEFHNPLKLYFWTFETQPTRKVVINLKTGQRSYPTHETLMRLFDKVYGVRKRLTPVD